MHQNCGLILEGGGLRGLYTAGIVDALLEHNIHIPYVIGVSAGACIAYSYVSKQIDRDHTIMTTYINDPRYFGLSNLIKEGNIFSRQFLYHDIHTTHVPFDMSAFNKSNTQIIHVATDCHTGRPCYYNGRDPEFLTTLAASASLPFVSKMVQHHEQLLLDGGISDSIPIKRSIHDGNTKNIVILTRPAGYRKKPTRHTWVIKAFYHKYPALATAIINRYALYNEALDFIEQAEKRGELFVIRPSQDLRVDRIEKNVTKLHALHALGEKDMTININALQAYLSR